MGYELRMNGHPVGTYGSAEEALERARVLVRCDPDFEVEILDTRTGRAFEPAASVRWRDELANKVGY